MKNFKIILSAGLVLTAICSTQAALSVTDFSTLDGFTYTGGGSGSQVIPDNTPTGVAYSINFGATGLNISDITFTLTLSGGHNGDLYAYVAHGDKIAYLLNPDPAVTSSGMNLTFVEGTGSPIPTGGSGTLSGSFTAYSDLASFHNTDPSGNWTVFFADLNPGDTSTLNGFSMSITAVPEPVDVALGVFAATALVFAGVRRVKRAAATYCDRS
ncbi:MAG: hypothetical protein ACTHLW_07290 [Verrucomicrobiota bacterium]